MALNIQADELLKRAAASGTPGLGEGTPEEGRAIFAATTDLLGLPAPEVKSTEEVQISGPNGDIRTLVITPKGVDTKDLPIFVYYHGGGWVIGSPETHYEECCHYANGAQCIVIVPDYRLAPEHPFPAAPEDCYAVLQWAADKAESLGGDKTRIAIGGDSAGGNLSAVVAQMTQQRSGPELALQLLIYPATRMGGETQSYKDFDDGYFLTAKAMHWFFDHYLTKPEDWDNVLASPLLNDDLAGLAPAYVMTAGFDPLRDEGRAYADKLEAAGVPVEYVCYEGQIHGFASMAGALDEARSFLDEAVQVLRKAFSK
ncbi:MAG: alpha/beta hydrolase [Gammaproteobacteria bacterium]|nr:alpha/beta hydrolase [Gammaproteobacteria bacterium]MBQ0838880.1 alpha/beta hydrolase [Gammaproteobacteria bacterium]